MPGLRDVLLIDKSEAASKVAQMETIPATFIEHLVLDGAEIKDLIRRLEQEELEAARAAALATAASKRDNPTPVR